ncbi:5547_t:CDS:1, partial [Cetraspora pellucida]
KENLATSGYNNEVIKIKPKSDDKDIMLDYSTLNIKSNKEEIFKDIGNYNERFS